MVVEYGTGLMALESLWQVAMDYLSHCPVQGHHYMQLLVERVPLTTERKANKVIHLCQRYHLKEQSESPSVLKTPFSPPSLLVKGVCKVLAMRAYKSGRLGAALTWCIRGKVSSGGWSHHARDDL